MKEIFLPKAGALHFFELGELTYLDSGLILCNFENYYVC